MTSSKTLFFIFLFFISQTLQAAEVKERRMAISLDSSSIRYTVADVNPETDSIVAVLDEDSIHVAFHEDLELNPDQSFSDDTIDETLHIFRKLKDKAEYYQALRIKAVATDAFRLASNRVEVIGKILGESGIRVQVIDESLEDRLDFFTAIRASQDEGNPVVWDIGGDSFQLIINDRDNQPLTYKGNYGSTTFLNYLLEVVQRKSLRETRNIHPLSREQFNDGLRFARHLARRTPDAIRSSIRYNQGQVIAIGSLFQKSILSASDRQMVTRSQLRAYIEKSLDQEKTESHAPDGRFQRKGFSHLSLSSAVLVYGFMEELGIEQLSIADNTTTDSILEFTPFWQ